LFKHIKGKFYSDIKQYIKALSKYFTIIFKEIFWEFITNFWKKIKEEIIIFIKNVAAYILKNQLKRHSVVLRSLINLLNNLTLDKINSCDDIYGSIMQVLTLATRSSSIATPSPLLHFADMLPGYSSDRALINVSERLNAAGIETGPIYGQDNNLLDVVKSIIDGHQDEVDNNSFVEIVLKPAVFGTTTIPPFLFKGVGKTR